MNIGCRCLSLWQTSCVQITVGHKNVNMSIKFQDNLSDWLLKQSSVKFSPSCPFPRLSKSTHTQSSCNWICLRCGYRLPRLGLRETRRVFWGRWKFQRSWREQENASEGNDAVTKGDLAEARRLQQCPRGSLVSPSPLLLKRKKRAEHMGGRGLVKGGEAKFGSLMKTCAMETGWWMWVVQRSR